jgi:3-deoxy-D-manno-octulosonic-acid transferase
MLAPLTILYRLGYEALLWLLVIVSAPLWLVWLLVSAKTRAGFTQKLGFWSPELHAQLAACPPVSQQPRLWVHAVSVGEFNAVLPLIKRLSTEPITLLVSVTTATAYRLAQKALPDGCVLLYFPFDLAWVQSEALRRLQPSLIVLTETELWPNLLFEASSRGCPVWLLNGRLSDRSFQRYKRVATLVTRPMLAHLNLALMQTEEDAKRIRLLGMSPKGIQVVGNSKFDATFEVDEGQVQYFRQLLGLAPTDWLLTVASTHPGEETMAMTLFERLKVSFPSLKMVLAPRHPHRCEAVHKQLVSRSLRHSLRSELSPEHPNTQPIVVLDTIGELLAVYSLSQAAIVCGSFTPIGGHNLLEAIALQTPVIYGPYMFNFKEVSAMVQQAGAGVQVPTMDDAEQRLVNWITQPEQLCQVVVAGQQLMEAHRGANTRLAKRILHQLL